MESKVIFGINMSHDTACAALIDGEIKVAIEEERLNGIKHCDGRSKYGRIIPYLSINYCLNYLGITADQVDLWVVNAVSSHIIKAFKLQMIGVPDEKIIGLPTPGHHLAHAYSAYHPSSFDDAAILVLDVNGGLHGVNDSKKENYSIYHGKSTNIEPVHLDSLEMGEISVPELYTIYSTVLQLSPTDRGDYGKDDAQRSGGKLMGYAAQYFNTELKRKSSGLLDKLLKKEINDEIILEFDKVVKTENHRYAIDMLTMIKYMKYKGKVDYVDHNFDPEKYFGWDLRRHINWKYRETSLHDHENAKFAYEGQLFLEEAIVRMANLAHDLTKSENICLAGGSMLNVVACNRVLKETPFKDLFVQPAAYDGGNAIGCALWGYYKYFEGDKMPYLTKTYHSYLGMQYSKEEVENAVNMNWALSVKNTKYENEDEQIAQLVSYLKNEEVICVFRGGSEFGPRALGNRSFLSNPNKAEMLNFMNEIKGREWYRPVAPIVLEEALHEYFYAPFNKAPFMTINAHCKEHTKKLAPAICHVDGSARVQTVSEEYHPFVSKLLRKFAKETGLPPILINTSFNIGGPIVETPAEAINTFLRGNYLVKALSLEDYIIELEDAEQDLV